MSAKNTIGRRVARAREARKMSQRELAEAAGVTEQALSRIENGIREPRVDTLRRLGKALGVGVGDLVDGPKLVLSTPSLRPEVQKVVDLLSDAPHDTLKLARRLVEVLIDERRPSS